MTRSIPLLSTEHVQVLLYSGKSLVSGIIRFRTWSKYSHVAMIIHMPGRLPLFVEAKEFKGVRATQDLKFIQEQKRKCVKILRPKPEVMAKIGVNIKDMYDFASKQVGKKYDYPSVVGFVTRRTNESRKSSEKWFCSELAFQIFKEGGIDLLSRIPAFKVCPGKFAITPLLE